LKDWALWVAFVCAFFFMNKSFHRITNKYNPPVKTGTQSDKLGLHQHHNQQSRTAAKTQTPKLTTYQHIQQTHPPKTKVEAQRATTENKKTSVKTSSKTYISY
jgi:hypothetical protein